MEFKKLIKIAYGIKLKVALRLVTRGDYYLSHDGLYKGEPCTVQNDTVISMNTFGICNVENLANDHGYSIWEYRN